MKKINIIVAFIIICMMLIPVFANDNIQKPEINNLVLTSNNEVELGEKLYFDFETTGEVNFATVLIQNEDVKDSFALVPILNKNSNAPQIDLSNIGTQNIIAGNYYIADVFLNPDDSNKYVHYSLNPKDENTKKLDFNVRFSIKDKKEENKIKLNSISLKGNNVITSDGDLYFDIDYSGEVSNISIDFRNKENEAKPIIGYLNINTKKLDFNTLSNKFVDGEYYVAGVNFFGYNGEIVQYTNYSKGNNVLYLDSKINFTVKNNTDNIETEENQKIELYKIVLNSKKAKLNDKIYVDLETSKPAENIMLSFFNNDTGDMLVAYLKDIDTANPYFIVPTTTKPGKYELNYSIIEDFDGNESHYRKSEQYGNIKHFDFNDFLEIEKELNLENNILNIDNEKIDSDILKQIQKLDSNVSININTNNDSIVSSNIFEAIKGTNKILILTNNNVEWVFNGNDIEEAKQINTSVNVFNISKENNSSINSKLNNGIVLEFASNGQLPGKCLIRIKHNNGLGEELNENLNLYYYNDEKDTLEKVDTQIIVTKDNYYEFYIDHNSKYILSDENIENNDMKSIKNELTNNNNTKTDKDITNIIIKVVVIIVCVIILILIFSKKILTNKKKENKEE
ncbi:MAG: hypothetical protein ACI4UE_04875 [Candidatus Scatovivens sp.]